MPQAVQNPLTIPAQSSYSTSRSTQAKSSDGSSFQDTLDEVQNKDGQSTDSESSAAPKADNAKPAATAKSPKKDAAKKTKAAAADKNDKPVDKSAKKADADEAQDGDPQTSAEDQQPETSQDDADTKPDKKKAPEPAAVSGPIADTVQVQNAATPVEHQPVAQRKPTASDEPKGGKKAAAVGKLQVQAVQKNSKEPTKADAQPAAPSDPADALQKANAPHGDDASQEAQAGQTGRRGKQALAIQPRKTADGSNDAADAATNQNAAVSVPADVTTDATAAATSDDAPVAAAGPRVSSRNSEDLLLNSAGAQTLTPGGPAKTTDTRAAATSPADPSAALSAAPEAQFADANHAKIVAGVHGQLLPNGGQMHIRLDPPELGSLHVRVEMRDGVMTASFETTNDHATRLLSHSLSDLKTALESQGVSVDKLQVRQSPKDQQSSGDDHQPDRSQDQARQQEQQRKEMVRRMWAKLMKGSDPLDLVA